MEVELIQKSDYVVIPITETVQIKLKDVINEQGKVSEDAIETVEKPFFGYISPSSTWSLIWQLIIIICTYIILIQIGFLMGFGSELWIGEISNRNTLGLSIVIMIFLVIDIVISLHRGFYKLGQGKVIKNRAEIMDHYLKGLFAIDIVSTILSKLATVCVIIPFLVRHFAADILQLVFFAKLFKKAAYEDEIKRQIQHKKGTLNAFSITVLTIDALVVAHFCACFFIGIDLYLYKIQYYQQNLSLYWLSNNADYTLDLFGGPWYEQYIYGQEYSSGTLSTLAPGPFPKNPIEVIYVIIVMLSFIILTSYIADGIVKIFFSEQLRRVFHETNIQAFDNFLNLKEVNKKVRQRVQNYFELVWEVEGKVDLQFQKQVISKLPAKLKVELQEQLYSIKKLTFLRNFAHAQELNKQVLSSVVQVMTDANQVLFEPKKASTDRTLSLLQTGMVKYYAKCGNEEAILSLSNNQKTIGLYEFITEQPYSYVAETLHISHLHILSLSAFLKITVGLGLKEKLLEIRHKVMYTKNFQLINKRCLVCFLFHLQSQCPQINVSAKIKEELIDEETSNERKRTVRKNKRNNRTLQGKRNRRQTVEQAPDLLQMMGFQDMFMPLTDFVLKLLKIENIDGWSNFEDYFPADNIKNIMQ